MSDEHIVRYTLKTRPRDKTDWARLDAMTEEEVEAAALSDPDAQPTDAAFWEDAQVILPLTKASLHIRLDADVLDWFKAQGKGYQTRMNAVLRAYVEAQKKRA